MLRRTCWIPGRIRSALEPAGSPLTPQVRVAAASRRGAGSVAVSDFGQGLPLRSACLDGSISVSAVQVS